MNDGPGRGIAFCPSISRNVRFCVLADFGQRLSPRRLATRAQATLSGGQSARLAVAILQRSRHAIEEFAAIFPTAAVTWCRTGACNLSQKNGLRRKKSLDFSPRLVLASDCTCIVHRYTRRKPSIQCS